MNIENLPIVGLVGEIIKQNNDRDYRNFKKDAALTVEALVGGAVMARCGGGGPEIQINDTGKMEGETTEECLKDVPGNGGFASTHVNDKGGLDVYFGELRPGVVQQIDVPGRGDTCATIELTSSGKGLPTYRTIEGEIAADTAIVKQDEEIIVFPRPLINKGLEP